MPVDDTLRPVQLTTQPTSRVVPSESVTRRPPRLSGSASTTSADERVTTAAALQGVDEVGRLGGHPMTDPTPRARVVTQELQPVGLAEPLPEGLDDGTEPVHARSPVAGRALHAAEVLAHPHAVVGDARAPVIDLGDRRQLGLVCVPGRQLAVARDRVQVTVGTARGAESARARRRPWSGRCRPAGRRAARPGRAVRRRARRAPTDRGPGTPSHAAAAAPRRRPRRARRSPGPRRRHGAPDRRRGLTRRALALAAQPGRPGPDVPQVERHVTGEGTGRGSPAGSGPTRPAGANAPDSAARSGCRRARQATKWAGSSARALMPWAGTLSRCWRSAVPNAVPRPG